MAAGEVDHPALARGIQWLTSRQEADGLWSQAHYTGGGFPRVFYLNYHGYPRFFPLWGPGALPQSQGNQQPKGRVRPLKKSS